MVLAIVIAVVVLIVLWVISVQNKLVKSDEFCNNALKQINVQRQVSRVSRSCSRWERLRSFSWYKTRFVPRKTHLLE